MKKTLKRLLVLMLTLVMVMQLIPGAQAAPKTSGSCGKNVKWSYNTKEKTLTISGKGAMTNYDSSDAPWMQWNTEMKKLVVKKGVTTIGDYAFADTNLTSASLPSTLTRIGSYAFFVAELKSITIPKNVNKIGELAFYGAPLKAFKVANGSKHFCAKSGVLYNKRMTTLIAYPDMKKDSSYTVPNGVKTIGKHAFQGSEAAIGGNHYLKKLTLPKTITKVSTSAFEWNCSISKIYFKGKAPTFSEDVFLGSDSTIYYPSKYRSSWKTVPKSLRYSAESEYMEEVTGIAWKSWKG